MVKNRSGAKSKPAAVKPLGESLKQLDLNEESAAVIIPTCSHCGKDKPSKRCAKRHPKCLKKIFCDEICEKRAHAPAPAPAPAKDEAAAQGEENQENAPTKDAKTLEAEAKAKAKAKKARKAAKGKSGGDGEFWWNNSVFASW